MSPIKSFKLFLNWIYNLYNLILRSQSSLDNIIYNIITVDICLSENSSSIIIYCIKLNLLFRKHPQYTKLNDRYWLLKKNMCSMQIQKQNRYFLWVCLWVVIHISEAPRLKLIFIAFEFLIAWIDLKLWKIYKNDPTPTPIPIRLLTQCIFCCAEFFMPKINNVVIFCRMPNY